jgi:hypothetical protein
MNQMLEEISRAERYNQDDIDRIAVSNVCDAPTRARRISALKRIMEHLRQAKLSVMRAIIDRDDFERMK